MLSFASGLVSLASGRDAQDRLPGVKAWPAPPMAALDPAPGRPLLFDSSAEGLVEVGPEVGPARMYVCGITPYDATHLGHANTYVAFDLLHRTLLDCGYRVGYTQNVTDVDDPLLERAERDGVDWRALAEDQVELFRTDMTALRVLPPHDYVGAVEAIPDVVSLIELLLTEGAVYKVDDPDYPDLYFDVTTDANFGNVSHLDEATALALFAERGGDPERPGKRNPLDCLVWRLARPGEPAWESSLGAGRPGWHIECAAIVLTTLGGNIDVQAGGSDLVFPHHEMCAAEAIVATGTPFAKAYVHSGMVGLDGEKMSKSKGNLVLVSRLRLDGVDPMAIRLALLSRHYRADWSYTDALLAEAQQRLRRWRDAVARPAAPAADELIAAVREALRTDLDAPAALLAVDAWADAVPGESGDPGAGERVAAVVDALLGVSLR